MDRLVALAEQHGRARGPEAAAGIFVLQRGDARGREIAPCALARGAQRLRAQHHVGIGDGGVQRIAGVDHVEVAGGDGDGTAKRVGRIEHVLRDAAQRLARRPAAGQRDRIAHIGQQLGDGKQAFEPRQVVVLQRQHDGREHLAAPDARERLVARPAARIARDRQAVEVRGQPVVEAAQVMQLRVPGSDQEEALVAQERSFLGVALHDERHRRGRAACDGVGGHAKRPLSRTCATPCRRTTPRRLFRWTRARLARH
jgi:hypothetical protein